MTMDAPLDMRSAAVPSTPANGAPHLADPADAVEAHAAQCDRHDRHDAGCHRRDLLYRPARHRAACRHRAGVSLRHADADDVGGRDGRRRFLRHQPGDRRGESRPRGDAGAACRDDRRLRRNLFHRDDADFRPRILHAARRARRRARAGHAIFARAVLRRDRDLAGQHAGLGGARHRRHADSIGDPDRHRAGADHGWRRAGPWAVRPAEIRHERRRRGPACSFHARGGVPRLVPRSAAAAG